MLTRQNWLPIEVAETIVRREVPGVLHIGTWLHHNKAYWFLSTGTRLVCYAELVRALKYTNPEYTPDPADRDRCLAIEDVEGALTGDLWVSHQIAGCIARTYIPLRYKTAHWAKQAGIRTRASRLQSNYYDYCVLDIIERCAEIHINALMGSHRVQFELSGYPRPACAITASMPPLEPTPPPAASHPAPVSQLKTHKLPPVSIPAGSTGVLAALDAEEAAAGLHHEAIANLRHCLSRTNDDGIRKSIVRKLHATLGGTL